MQKINFNRTEKENQKNWLNGHLYFTPTEIEWRQQQKQTGATLREA